MKDAEKRKKLELLSLAYLPLSIACFWFLSKIPSHPLEFSSFLIWLFLCYCSLRFRLFFKGLGHFDISGVFFLAVVIVYGPLYACAMDIAGTFSLGLPRKRFHHQYVRDTFKKPIAYAAGSIILLFSKNFPFPSLASLMIYAVFHTSVLLAEFLLDAQFQAIATGIAFTQFTRKLFAQMPWFELYGLIFPLGVVLAYLVRFDPPYIFLLIIPILVSRQTLKYLRDIQQEVEKTLSAMSGTLEAKDDYTERHTDRVSKYSGIIAKWYGIPGNQVETIVKAAKLHDIGKIVLDDEVLRKPGKLTKEEYEHIKLHVQYDFVTDLIPLQFPIARWLRIARMHHERFDGQGYPFGLKGEEIPIEARIVSVADAWDAMTSNRVYRQGLTEERALQILKENAGTQWDPEVVEAFFKAYDTGDIQAVSADYKAWLKRQEWDALQKLRQVLSFNPSSM